MLDNFRNGSSVKIVYDYTDYVDGRPIACEKLFKGLLYKTSPSYVLLVSEKPLKSLSFHHWTENILILNVNFIKDISSTRLKKEVSDILNKQLKNVLESRRIKDERERLQTQQAIIDKEIENNSIELLNVLSSINFNDVDAWKEKIKRDFSRDKFNYIYDNNTKLNFYFNNLSIKRNFSEITLTFIIDREERLLSKEFEDRIRGNESVSKNEIANFTPKIDKLNQVFQGKAIIAEPVSRHTIQDKGWVSFYTVCNITFKVDLKEYDTWCTDLISYINRYFKKVSSWCST